MKDLLKRTGQKAKELNQILNSGTTLALVGASVDAVSVNLIRNGMITASLGFLAGLVATSKVATIASAVTVGGGLAAVGVGFYRGIKQGWNQSIQLENLLNQED